MLAIQRHPLPRGPAGSLWFVLPERHDVRRLKHTATLFQRTWYLVCSAERHKSTQADMRRTCSSRRSPHALTVVISRTWVGQGEKVFRCATPSDAQPARFGTQAQQFTFGWRSCLPSCGGPHGYVRDQCSDLFVVREGKRFLVRAAVAGVLLK